MALPKPGGARSHPAVDVDVVRDPAADLDGTAEAMWLPWLRAAALPVRALDSWLPPGSRAVVVAPHPDDEVIGFGALLAAHARRGGELLLLAVTDGEASHPGSSRWSPVTLVAERERERRDGLGRLGFATCRVERCGLPDGAVAAQAGLLEAALSARLQPGDVLLTTWRLDGHADHEATGRAVARVAARSGHRLLEAPVWMWHWATPADPRVPWLQMAGFAASAVDVRARSDALQAHRSQLDSGEQGCPPVLGPQMVLRAARAVDWFIESPAGA